MARPKELALDTNLLLDLAEEKDWAHEFRERFQEADYRLLCPRAVLEEIVWFEVNGDPRKRKLASTVLDHFQEWTLESFEVPAEANAAARRFGLFLIRKSLLPPKEKSDGLILGQTSWAEISLLVTSDHHLLEIDPALLAQTFVEAGLFPVTPVHPRALMRAVR